MNSDDTEKNPIPKITRQLVPKVAFVEIKQAEATYQFPVLFQKQENIMAPLQFSEECPYCQISHTRINPDLIFKFCQSTTRSSQRRSKWLSIINWLRNLRKKI